MRTLHPATLAKLKTSRISVYLLKLDLTPTPVYLTNAPVDITYNGNIYLGNSKVLKMGKLVQTSDLRINAITLEFDAAEPSLTSLFLNNSQVARAVEIYYAILNDDYSIAGTPILMERRSIDGDPAITDNPKTGKAVLKIKASTDWANSKATNGRATTPERQHQEFPNDTGFDYAPMASKEIKWGRK